MSLTCTYMKLHIQFVRLEGMPEFVGPMWAMILRFRVLV